MARHTQFDQPRVSRLLNRLRPDRGIVNRHISVSLQFDGNLIRAGYTLAPHNQLKRPIALSQQQVVDRGWLNRNRITQAERFVRRIFVRQDRREIVQIDRRLSRCVIGGKEAESLIATFVRTISKQIDGRIAPASLVLAQVHVHQVYGVYLFRHRSADRCAGLGRDAPASAIRLQNSRESGHPT